MNMLGTVKHVCNSNYLEAEDHELGRPAEVRQQEPPIYNKQLDKQFEAKQ